MANFGLKYAALQAKNPELKLSQFYVFDSFYMDDGLYSTRSPDEAITVLSGAREMLGEYKIRLHKHNSNSTIVLKAFPSTEVQLLLNSDLSPLSFARIGSRMGRRVRYLLLISQPRYTLSQNGASLQQLMLLPMTLLVSSHLSSSLENSFRGKYFPLKNPVVNL